MPNHLAERQTTVEPVDQVKKRYGVETLEEAFFAATGRAFEEEHEDDEQREVFG